MSGSALLDALDDLVEAEKRLRKREAVAQLERRTERQIGRAFRGQRDTAIRRLRSLAPHYGLTEAMRPGDAAALVAAIIAALAPLDGLALAVGVALTAAWGLGVRAVRGTLGQGAPGPASPTAAQLAAQAAGSAGLVDATTAADLGRVLATAAASEWSVAETVAAVEALFDGYTARGGRAALIAGETINDAYEAGQHAAALVAGLGTKQWVTAGDSRVDDVCLANEADGAIPIGDTFPSGDERPPAHFSCRCDADYADDGGME